MTRKTQTLKKVKSQKKSKSQLCITRKVLKHKGGRGYGFYNAVEEVTNTLPRKLSNRKVRVSGQIPKAVGDKGGKILANLFKRKGIL
jgi:hypothetical protein